MLISVPAGNLQYRTVESALPENSRISLAELAQEQHKTGPLCPRNVYRGSTSGPPLEQEQLN